MRQYKCAFDFTNFADRKARVENLHFRFIKTYTRVLLKARYRGTILGFMWNLFQPALQMVILSLVFSIINRMKISDYAIYLFSGLIPWRFLESSTISGTDSLINNACFSKKIKIPSHIFPTIQCCVCLTDWLYSFSVMFLIIFFLRPEFHLSFIAIPFSMLVWVVASFGLAYLFSGFQVLLRDVKQMVQLGMMLTFFMSPILYRPELVLGDRVGTFLLDYNPMTYLLNLFQKPIYYTTFPSYQDWLISIIFSIILLCLGKICLESNRDKYYYYL